MFNIFSRSNSRTTGLFEDKFQVIDITNEYTESREELCREGNVSFKKNMFRSAERQLEYYEVLYQRELLFTFLVFHSDILDEAQQLFDTCKVVLNSLEQEITLNKVVAAENLRSIMNCLRHNPKWTCAHVCARLGYDDYFTSPEDRPSVVNEINIQMEPDRLTPLHLAIQSLLLPTVRLILNFGPDLDLLEAKGNSILHFAAISTQEILTLILAQPGMFYRILWRNHHGCTALHLACYIQKFDNVFEFLKFGLTVRMLTLSPPNTRTKTQVNLFDQNDPLNRIVRFTEQDFDDLDCQDIFSGGSPLHWVKHKRLMDKLIQYRFSLNIKNLNRDTALHIMAKRLRLRCVITLLSAGANVNAANIFGNTPLHHAVKQSDLVVPQTLIVFDADINAKNFKAESVRHITCKENCVGNETVLFLLAALGARRCPPSMTNCSEGCIHNGDFEGHVNQKLEKLESKYDNIYKDFLFGDILRGKMERTDAELNSTKRANLLSLDGGGIKGLISIQVLIEIEKFLQHPIHHYFKWLSGTSTGSFIAVFLAMGKSLAEIRTVYFRLKDKVLTGSKPFDSESFERVIREEMGELRMRDLKERYNKFVLIPSMLSDRKPMRIQFFRSYDPPERIFQLQGGEYLQNQIPDLDSDMPDPTRYDKYKSDDYHLWKACRASGAAPTYFRAYECLLDGGFAANNPTLDAIADFQAYQCALRAVGRSSDCEQLDMVLSIGCGKSRVEPTENIDIATYYSLNNIRQFKNLINLLVYEVCQTEQHIVNRAESACSMAGVPYFRINSMLGEMIEIDEQLDHRVINSLWETKRFMYVRREQVKQLVRYLEHSTQDLPKTSSFKGKSTRTTSKTRRQQSSRLSQTGSSLTNSKRSIVTTPSSVIKSSLEMKSNRKSKTHRRISSQIKRNNSDAKSSTSTTSSSSSSLL